MTQVKADAEKSEGGKEDSPAMVDVRDEQARRTVVVSAPFFLILAAPIFLAMENERSLWRMTRHDSIGRVLVLAVLAWPICLGLLGLSRGLRRLEPGKWLMRLGTGVTSLYTLAGTALVSMIFLFEHRAVESPLAWGAVLLAIIAAGSLVRSFFYTGWRRWQFVAAPIALHAAVLVMLFAAVEPRAIERADEGGWLFLFGAGGLLPFVGTAWMRKK